MAQEMLVPSVLTFAAKWVVVLKVPEGRLAVVAYASLHPLLALTELPGWD